LSRLIKSSYVVSLDDLKKLEAFQHVRKTHYSSKDVENTEGLQVPDAETLSMKEQILRDAEAFAEERVRQASEEAARQLAEASAQIEAWWSEKRAMDLEAAEAARQAGFEQGYQEGFTHGEAELKQRMEQQLQESQQLLETAYRMREQIIQEAEPFLVELSCAIAEKIIGRELAASPELPVELIRKALARRREQGVITLCVSPAQLAYVQAAREELVLAVDSQAELQILPDASVRDHGCVIRSAFGSIDARIGTQLEEIKRELVAISLQIDETRSGNGHDPA